MPEDKTSYANNKEPKFVDGLIIKKPKQNAPKFIIANISIKREELTNWLNNSRDEWINLDVKESKKGSWYAQVNEWKSDPRKPFTEPKKSTVNEVAKSNSEVKIEDIPF